MSSTRDLTVEEAFQDFVDVGCQSILTLIDSIMADRDIDLPNEMEIILCAVLGKYCHHLQLHSQMGYTPSQSHAMSVLGVLTDPRVSSFIDHMMKNGIEASIEGIGDE